MEGIECFGYLFTNRPLKERFERASQQLKYTCRRKTRLARVGVETYPLFELRLDLYAAAGDHGLFAEALQDYFLMLHGPTARSKAGDLPISDVLRSWW